MNAKLVIKLSCSFLLFGFRPSLEPVNKKAEITGVWKGGFGNQQEIKQAVVYLKAGNQLDFYEGASVKSTGTYRVSGDSILILSISKAGGEKYVQMTGHLNKTKNFVDGVWQMGEKMNGSFYLQKQLQ